MKAQKTGSWIRITAIVALTIFAVLGTSAIILYILRNWGLESMLILFVAVSAAGWGCVLRWLWKDGRITLSHILVIWMVWTGTVLSGASYYLAYRGLSADLETLSRYIMVEVVAGVGGYFVKSGIENVMGGKSRSRAEQSNDDVPKDLF